MKRQPITKQSNNTPQELALIRTKWQHSITGNIYEVSNNGGDGACLLVGNMTQAQLAQCCRKDNISHTNFREVQRLVNFGLLKPVLDTPKHLFSD
jgi:hypothetical protein